MTSAHQSGSLSGASLMRLPDPTPAADAPPTEAVSPRQRGLEAIRAGRIPGIPGESSAVEDAQGGEEPAGGGATPDEGATGVVPPGSGAPPAGQGEQDTVAAVVARVKAKLAESKPPPQAQQEPAQQPAAAPPPQQPPPGEPTYTRAQLLEQLQSERALDFLIEELGADAAGLYDRMTDRAQTRPHERRALSEIERLAAKQAELQQQIERDRAERAQQAQQAEYQRSLDEFRSHVRGNASAYPLLASEPPEMQAKRAVSAAQKLIRAGEGDATAELIAALAEDEIRESLRRYPGVSLGAGRDPAVGAGQGSREPTTLSGSISGETVGGSDLPPLGSRARREHFARRAEVLLRGA